MMLTKGIVDTGDTRGTRDTIEKDWEQQGEVVRYAPPPPLSVSCRAPTYRNRCCWLWFKCGRAQGTPGRLAALLPRCHLDFFGT